MSAARLAALRYALEQPARLDHLYRAAVAHGVARARRELGLPESVTPGAVVVRRGEMRAQAFYHAHVLRGVRDLLAAYRAARERGDDPEKTLRDVARRLDRTLAGIRWLGAEAGYVAAALAVPGVRVIWQPDPHSDLCWLCDAFAKGSPYHSWQELPAIPGDGTTPCGDHCHCSLVAVPGGVLWSAQRDVLPTTQ